MAELGSEGDPPQASSLARFWPGGDAAAAAVDGARRPDEVELMPAGTGGEWRRGGAVDRGGWDGRGNLGAREWKGRVGERGAPEMETVAGWVRVVLVVLKRPAMRHPRLDGGTQPKASDRVLARPFDRNRRPRLFRG